MTNRIVSVNRAPQAESTIEPVSPAYLTDSVAGPTLHHQTDAPIAAFVNGRIPAANHLPRPRVKGRFLHLGEPGEPRFFVRGVSYGSFAERLPGLPFPHAHVVSKDFARMQAAGINTVRLYDLPPTWLLDMAEAAGLRIILGFPWSQHICLDVADRRRVVQQIYRTARTHASHPAVLMCCVGNEIPSSIVRWYGKEKTERFIAALCDAVHEAVPEALVTYANYPTTEYLELPSLDVASYNVYLHERAAFQKYLMRLHTLAGDRPLLLTELGTDSLREGEDQQAAFLRTQLRAAFDHGVCGAVTFSWTDEWFRGGREVDDWAFGLVDRERHPKPAYFAVQETLEQTPFDRAREWPKVTVTVATYNAAATLDECLTSLMRLNYPDYEVLVVNDGSVDESAAIAERYTTSDLASSQPGADKRKVYVRVFHTENRGLSAARNLGLAHAQGEIVAYTDSDCVADPDWLRYLVLALKDKSLAGVGGPNYTPPDDGWIAQRVACAPGNPNHILLNDEIAEHIPGCNMAFWRKALEEVGGFDPDFCVAGDDVDICWRLQDCGYQIGFAPTAFVWHRRRNSIRAFLKQQVGYGRSEAILETHHPHKFNRLRQICWSGSIYGPSGLLSFRRRVRIYFGEFGSAPFQTLESSPPAWWMYIPQMPEWHLMILLCMAAAFFLPWLAMGGVVAFALTLFQATYLGWATPLPARLTRGERMRRRGVVALLNWLQPLARSWGRLQGGLCPWGFTTGDGPVFSLRKGAQLDLVANLSWQRLRAALWPVSSGAIAYWSETGHELEDVLRKLIAKLYRQRLPVQTGDGWNRWDIQIRRLSGVQACVYSGIEYHGGPRRLLRFRLQTQVARWAYLVEFLLVLFAVGAWQTTWASRGDSTAMPGTIMLFAVALPVLWPIWLVVLRLQLVEQVMDALESVTEELVLTRLRRQPQPHGHKADESSTQELPTFGSMPEPVHPAEIERIASRNGHPLGAMHSDVR